MKKQREEPKQRIDELEKIKEDWARKTVDKLLKIFFTEELDHMIDNDLKERGLV